MQKLDKIYTFQVDYKGNDGFNSVQFCCYTREQAADLFYQWCRDDLKLDMAYPIHDVIEVYNEDDHEEYKSDYGIPFVDYGIPMVNFNKEL